MPRIATLDSTRKKEQEKQGNTSARDEDEGGNEYYSGGTGNQGQGSGLAVLAPNRGGGGENDMRSFIADIQRQQPPPGAATSAPHERRTVQVAIYANGFTLDDGPFRASGDPLNADFLKSLRQGYCPAELVENGKPANVSILDRTHEEYTVKAEAKKFTSFEGTGSRVGGDGPRSPPVGVIVKGTEEGFVAPVAGKEEDKTVVRIQLKYKGKKRVLVFGANHTVRALIAKVEAELNEELGEAYQLLHGPKLLPLQAEQFDISLLSLGLNNSLVTVQDVEL